GGDLAIRASGGDQARDRLLLRREIGPRAALAPDRLEPARLELSLAALLRRARAELGQQIERAGQLVGGRAPAAVAAQELPVGEPDQRVLVGHPERLDVLARAPERRLGLLA